MASNRRLSTAGITLSYAVEATAGTMPTTAAAYTLVPEVKVTPSTNPEPNSIDVTPLSELEFIQYIAGLKDLGGVMAFTANLTEDVIDVWNNTLMTAYEAGQADGKETWFCIQHPKLAEAVFFKGEPVPLGMNETSVNAALETTLYIAPQSAPQMLAKPSV